MNEAKKGFYKALEDKFRGERDEIKSRLEVYLPFVNVLKKIHPEAKALDLGCGRGEWLELLRDNGFSVQGVDLDEGMLAACRERGFQVETADAIDFLSGVNNESVSVISAFHVVEHISFDKLQTLVEESLRVLQPGGLLILETPNSENIMVGISSFYLDPTHHRPIPPQLLSFLPDYYGFYRSKILRLQESSELSKNYSPTLSQVIVGSSPDYSVIAQKKSDVKTIAMFDSFFNVEYGLSLTTLAARYDENIHNEIHQLESKVFEVRSGAEEAKRVAEEAREELKSIHNSRSWRITAPLRWFLQQVRLLRNYGLKARLKVGGEKIAYKCKAVVRKYLDPNDVVKHKIIVVADRLGFYPVLRSIYRRFIKGTSKGVSSGCYGGLLQPNSLDELPPRAKQLYFELKSSSSQQQESH